MSCSPAGFNGIEFIHVVQDFKKRVWHWNLAAPRTSHGPLMSRRRASSVPIGAVIIALVAIAVMALLALYVGDGIVLTRFADNPLVESEDSKP
jgi:hypothetical protein